MHIVLGAIMPRFEYLKLADTIAAEIADGRLKPGDRLPPQRNFAWERKIAVSTASRVYAELLRRGLIVGEVGRGTFISGEAKRGAAAPSEPRGIKIDLEFNYPMRPDQAALIAKSLDGLEKPAALSAALAWATSVGTPALRNTTAAHLSQDSWAPESEQIVFAGNGRQSIAAAISAVVPTGGRCGVEALTYPFIKGIAAKLGISLVPLAMDEDGVRPDSVQKAHREAHLSAIYVQPATQNPLGVTMPPHAAPTCCASSKSSAFRSSKTTSTASSEMIPRWLHWRRTAVSSSIVCPRGSPRDWRWALSCPL